MRLQDDIDFTTLNWVKQELDETLKQARQALEAYVEDPADTSLMRFCATYLHQVQGTLRMVELYGAAMVVEEMERVAHALLDDQIKQRDEAYSVLMRGIVQLPDYLERLQSGHKDIPIVLLPLLNDLRACRGEKLLTESVLFSPDLAAPMPGAADGAHAATPPQELRGIALKARLGFQAALLKWLRDERSGEHPARLQTVLDKLRGYCSEEEVRRLWWIAAGVLDAIRDGGLEPSVAVKLLFGRVDREIKQLAETGEEAFRASPPRELVKNLLYYVAHSTSASPRIAEIRGVYKLDSLLPTEKELEHARGSMSGHNRTLLDTVSIAIKDDLLRVKEALDIFLRAQNANPAELMAQVDVLDRVGDTLGMLGLGVPRRVVTEQREIIEDMANSRRGTDEGTLLDVAGALLYVEASLDDHIERLGASGAGETVGGMELPKAEVRKILDALMREAAVNIQQAKHDIVAFIESPWDHARVEQIPRLLEEISGALRMLALEEPARLMGGIVRFVEVELLRHRRVPTAEQMDKLADALASIEYYLEATREQRGGRERILDVTRESLESLGYWPVPEDDGGGPSPARVPDPTGPSATANRSDFSGAPSAIASAPSSGAAHGDTLFARAASLALSESTREAQGLSERATPTSEGSEFPSWSEHLPITGSDALRMDVEDSSDASLPSIDLPGDEPPIESGPVDFDTPSQVESHELRHAVEIAPGHDLHDLVVGESRMPEPAAHDLAGLRLAETSNFADSDDADGDERNWIEVEEEIEEEVAGDSLTDASFQNVSSDEIDDEIREVFVEEVQEEIDNLRRAVPEWRSNVDDSEKLKPVRRSFHTLKGSGRLVGAMALGEFSWKVENMLNRVLDKTIAPSMAVQTLVDQSVAALPELLAALRGEGSPHSNIAGIMSTADRLAAGEEAWVPSSSGSSRKIKRIVRRRVPAASAPSTTAAPMTSAPVELTQTFDITQEFDVSAGLAHEASGDSSTPPGAGIDPVLFEILKSEVAMHLASIEAYLDACRAAPVPATEALLRAVHTLNGAIAMVDIPSIGHVLAPLEGYVKRLRADGASATPHGIDALVDTVALVREVIGRLDRGSDDLPDSTALALRVTALRDELPEPTSSLHLYTGSDSSAPDATSEDGASGDAITRDAAATLSAADHAAFDRADDSISFADSAFNDAAATTDEERALEAALLAETHNLGFGEQTTEESWFKSESESLESNAALVPESTLVSTTELTDADSPMNADVPTVAAVEGEDLTAALMRAFAEPELEQPGEGAAAIEVDEVALTSDGAAHDLAAIAANEVPSDASSDALGLDSFASVDEPTLAHDAPPSMPEAAHEAAAFADKMLASEDDSITFEDEPLAFEDEPEAHVAASPEPVVARAERDATPEAPPIADDAQPEGKLELADMDEDLLEIFVQEGTDILDHSDTLMARLREQPHERELITGLQRDLHTLKGGARMASLAPIGDLSHVMESLLEAITDGRRGMDRVTVESLERGFDRLHGLVQRVAHRQAIAMPEHAITRFEQLVAGESIKVASADAETQAEASAATPTRALADIETRADVSDAKDDVEQPVDPIARTPRAGRLAPRQLPSFEEEDTTRAPQEMIRVRSELLDSLVNYAGEVSIYRSRLEQQISTFRFNLVEFEQTVSRLREQLRKLEIETEAQIIARYQREHHEPGQVTFDPLELDRFSQLQQLSRALGESVSDLVSIQGLLDDLTRQSETLLLQQSRVSSDLQEGLMRTRMVPFDSLVPSLRRTLRQAATEIGKRGQLKVEGAQGEMDRNLLERMKAPFEHMLRNALAHGIESPEERERLNKPAEGTVLIQVAREATEVVLRVSDDGRGMDREAIRRKAIERGMLKPDVQLSDRDLYGFILETGFSTAETVTQLAGRGVGMDVVHNEIKQLGGSLVIDSQHGLGSTFTIRLPFTLAVTQAILVKLGESIHAIPMSSVQGVVRISRDDLDRRLATPNPSYSYAGEEFFIYELSQLLGVPPTRMVDETQLPLLMTRTGDQRAAVRIDAVVGSREIVVKSVGPQISSVPGIFGATIMGDGSVVMILDLAPLVRRVAALREQVRSDTEAQLPVTPYVAPVAPPVRKVPLVMVVDDSITMRKVTTRVLERADMEVVTAKDGLDAVEKLQDKVPDLVLLDIEMPRMDGYELATYMKNDMRLKLVPIIMITSRTGEKHRQRALEIGVERYLGKPYQEADLLRNVQDTLRLTRAES